MTVLTELWFWLLIVGLILLGFGVYAVEVTRENPEGPAFWGYLLLIMGAVLLIIAIFLVAARSGYLRHHPEEIIRQPAFYTAYEPTVGTMASRDVSPISYDAPLPAPKAAVNAVIMD